MVTIFLMIALISVTFAAMHTPASEATSAEGAAAAAAKCRKNSGGKS